MTKKRIANQYSGGNLLTQREADRIHKQLRMIEKMIRERGLYIGLVSHLNNAKTQLKLALLLSDR